ncbi:Uncharacterised protein [Cedecea neteri]|uniref:Uncharacterized protein n=1 Tax=Cedecea neteri TaxID=158822 RepID=A0A2X3J858_9ENTR|nr:Uncharacterised protein [Cedecea neteri]
MRERNNVPPLKIDSADFSKNLGMYSRNSEHTEQFLASGIEDYHIDGYVPPANYSLVKSLFEDQYRIVTTDEGKPYTAYAVKLVHHREITYPHSAVTQVMVWRTPSSRHYSAIQGFAKLFFPPFTGYHQYCGIRQRANRRWTAFLAGYARLGI